MTFPELPPPGCRICGKPMVETLIERVFLCPRCDRAPRPTRNPVP